MKECGECTLCCFHCAIKEQDSPNRSWCKSLKGNCSIYDDRPQDCRNFECLWLMEPNIPESLRPDKCGVMFDHIYGTKIWLACVNEGATIGDEVLALIGKLNAVGDSVVVQYLDGTIGYSLGINTTLEEVQTQFKGKLNGSS